MRLALVIFVISSQVVGKQSQLNLGPFRALNCWADAGVNCGLRGDSLDLRCTSATATEAGCITPSDQSFAGKKTFTNRTRVACKAHASLTACSSGEKGTWQTCCDHSAPVFCDGTSNHEFLGSSSAEQVLGVIKVDGIPVALMGGTFTPPTTTTTITAVEGAWGVGATSDGGTLIIKLNSGASTCSCPQPCASPTGRTPCSGTCTGLSALTSVTSSTTCTADPYVGGDLIIKGTP